MIPRYTRPEMSEIWSDRARYLRWLEVEHAVCRQLARERVIPQKDWQMLEAELKKLARTGGVDPARVEAIEATTRHDVLAFTTAVAERVGPISRWVHFGLTSSDVVDTAFSMQIQAASRLLAKGYERLIEVCEIRAKRHKKLATIGRSHGIFAEPTSFGLKFLGWAQEWKRNLERLEQARGRMATGKLSGAVGASPHFSPEVEAKILKELGLRREKVSTQVIPRDHHAELLSMLAVAGGSLERIAVEFRHLQRSEVAEVRESFRKGQKGSSAMPHKRNPISSENLTGCARLLRSYAQAALENVPLWHERDISHSSVERVVFPDAFILLDYAIHRMIGVLEGLEIDEKRVRANLEAAGDTSFSGHLLLELVRRGMSREAAYAEVQAAALAAIDGGKAFVEVVSRNKKVTDLIPAGEIRKVASLGHQLRHVDAIFNAALGDPR